MARRHTSCGPVRPKSLESTEAGIRERFGERVTVAARQGYFNDILPQIPAKDPKAIFFFGGSLGNIETLQETVEFLKQIRERMTVSDRFLVGVDLHKDEGTLRQAYQAGARNLSFFLNMLRRINKELGANLDLAAFQQESTYDEHESYEGIRNRCVNLNIGPLMSLAGLRLRRQWFDKRHYFSVAECVRSDAE